MKSAHVIALVLLVISGLDPSEAQTAKKTTSGRAPMPAAQKNSPQKLPFADARNMTVVIFWAEPRPRIRPVAIGSGVWIGKNGYIATCQHVIGNRQNSFLIGVAIDTYVSEHLVVARSDRLVDADLVVADQSSDVAILKAHTTPDQLRQQSPVDFFGPGKPPAQVIPQGLLTTQGATLKTVAPEPGETILLAGFPLGENALVLQTGVATGFYAKETPQRSLESGLRIMLSLVSNPGDSGSPVFDTDGKVIGLLEANLASPIRDAQGHQLYSPTINLDANGQPARDATGQPKDEFTPVQEKSGVSLAVPAKFIADLAEKNHIILD
jgi:S1-C subfamily serine protease